MLVLMLVLLFVPMKSSRFFCFYLPTCIITLRQGGAQTHAHAPISLLLQFSRGKKEENKNSRMQFRFRQFRLWVRDSLKKTGKALHTKTTSTTTTVKLHHKEPEKLKRRHCCCFTTTSLHPEMHQTSFSCRDFGFFRRFFTPNTKRGLNKRITKTYCPKNTLHRKQQQQQLHFALKESEKCIIIICGEEIYVKKESKIFSKPGNYKMQKSAFSNCMMDAPGRREKNKRNQR